MIVDEIDDRIESLEAKVVVLEGLLQKAFLPVSYIVTYENGDTFSYTKDA